MAAKYRGVIAGETAKTAALQNLIFLSGVSNMAAGSSVAAVNRYPAAATAAKAARRRARRQRQWRRIASITSRSAAKK